MGCCARRLCAMLTPLVAPHLHTPSLRQALKMEKRCRAALENSMQETRAILAQMARDEVSVGLEISFYDTMRNEESRRRREQQELHAALESERLERQAQDYLAPFLAQVRRPWGPWGPSCGSLLSCPRWASWLVFYFFPSQLPDPENPTAEDAAWLKENCLKDLKVRRRHARGPARPCGHRSRAPPSPSVTCPHPPAGATGGARTADSAVV